MDRDINKEFGEIRNVVYIDSYSNRDETGIVPVETLWIKFLPVDGQGI